MKQTPWQRASRTAIALAAAALVSPVVLAQNTTSGINGIVTGADGKPVAGATVTIVHVESGSTNTVTTDAAGRYAARGLRAGGPYTITVSQGGLTERREGVVLSLAETFSYDAVIGGASQTVTVTGRGVSDKFSRSNMGAGTNIGQRELNSLASLQRNLQDYARTDPRLAQTDKERGEISAAGQNTRYNSITIDGVTISDTFGLEANNLPTAKQPISIDAIQSVQVNVSNYDTTQKGYTGANINAVTKSGTNEFKGSVFVVHRNESMVGDRYNVSADTYFKVAPFKEETLGFTLGGPIIKDKLFFFASYEELKSNRVQPEFGPVGSELTNVAISQSAITSMTNIARTAYGFDPGVVNGSGQLDVKDLLIKLDWNISDAHRANLRYTKTEQGETNNGAFNTYSPTSLQMTSAWWLQEKTIETVVGQWFADWSPTFSTELKLSKRDYSSVPRNNTRLPAMALQFSGPAPAGAPATVNTGNRFLNFGTELSRHFNVLETETVDAYAGATWTLGDHELKLGGDLSENQVYNAFFQNTLGNYTFACVNAAAATPTAPAYTYNFNGNITTFSCATATAAQIEQAVLENFERGRPSSYQVQLPVAGTTLNDGAAQWTLRNTGLFLQDTWKLSRKFTLMAGLRYDMLSTGDKPRFNSTAAAPTVAGSFNNGTGAVTRNTGGFGLDNSVTADGENLLQPRLGFNWDLSSPERRMQLRGGVGLFQGAAANVWLSNPYSNTGLATRIVGCGTGGFAACPSTPGLFSPNPDTQPTPAGTPPAANVDFHQAGLGQPSIWKMNLAFETELPNGLVASAEWLYSRTDSALYYQHLNLGGATRTGIDGRQFYYTPQALSTACWSPAANGNSAALVTNTPACNTTNGQAGARARAMANSAFNNVLLATESKQGRGTSITVGLAQPTRDGFAWSAYYTRSSATEASPLTSSVANSNFNARSVLNPNQDEVGTSAYLIRDRFSGSLSWSKPLFTDKYRTTFGLMFEGRKGKPFSWTFRNDMNGDGVAGNDLMYIPRAPGSGEVAFFGATPAASAAAEARFWSVVESDEELNASRGGVVKRGGSYSRWSNNFDFRMSQEMPGFTSKHKGVLTLDIMNVGNLLNPRWGRIEEVGFNSAGGNRRTFVSFAGINGQGQYVYVVGDPDAQTLRQAKGESQWALQITARYEF
jgi:hypothetical protein